MFALYLRRTENSKQSCGLTMDNVTLKAPDNRQSFNYPYTRGTNIKFIPYPIHYESANPMSTILIEKVLLAQLEKKFTPFFTERDLSLLFAHDNSIGTYHQGVECSSVRGTLLRVQ
jgi:hypothetical protein